MKEYTRIVQRILEDGVRKSNRTGIDTLMISGMMFEHDMSTGFPLLTSKYVPFALVASELEFFIKGITDKKWLQERKNHIWDEWCSPDIVPYGHDEKVKQQMMEERDLGPIYGFQWRQFGAGYESYQTRLEGGVDQLQRLVKMLKTNPDDRRMIVSAWNPMDLERMALPPCHYAFQVTTSGGKLNLMWNQRSVDVALGLPFNIASYGLLLSLLAREAGLEEGRLVGFLGDTHIYENHVAGLETQIARPLGELPAIETPEFESIFSWTHTDTQLLNYTHHPAIRFDIAV
ncbi:MAG: thymidylate synthase [Desulfobacterales bacterium]|nr:thymidylate synthase [Desulfobacterales bacterium]